MKLGELFTHNYKDISIVAKRITRRHNISPTELMNVTYLSIHHKTPPNDNLGFVKWFSRAMKINSIDKRGEIQKLKPNNEELKEVSTVDESFEVFNESIELSPSISESKAKQIAPVYSKVIIFKNSLPLWEKYVFELYYEKGLSAIKIGKETNISRKTIDKFVKSIKTKISKTEWN